MPGMATNLSPSGNFLILEETKNRKGLSQKNKVDGPLL
jgi:hypothetical protein